MKAVQSRFSSLAKAVKDGTAVAGEDVHLDPPFREMGAGVHKPATALAAAGETLRDHVSRLEAELVQVTSENTGLLTALERAKTLRERAGDAIEEFLFLETTSIADHLPRDRLRGRAEGPEFDDLLADIEKNGQNDAITVRRMPDSTFEIAAGRRRLAVCERLSRLVLARVRDLDDQAMLRIQFSENERRADISALERARWFSEVRDRVKTSAKEIAAHFGIDPSTLSLYLRLARFPDEILERLEAPQRLAVLPARRIMEVIETDPTAVQRIQDALDAYKQSAAGSGSPNDPAAQIDVLIRAAEGRAGGYAGHRNAVPERRHIVHQGRRIGTLTRNGGQWVFRFATSIPDTEVQALAERLAIPVTEPDAAPPPHTTRRKRT